MVFHKFDLLYIVNSLLLLKFHTFYGPLMTSLVVYLILFLSFLAKRPGLFLAFSLCFSCFNFIGSHHVTKISFLGFYNDASPQPTMIIHSHVTHLYTFFLRSGINLEGNIKG